LKKLIHVIAVIICLLAIFISAPVSKVSAAPIIDITVPANISIALVPGIIPCTATGTITVTAAETTTWVVSASDTDIINTNGKMTAFASTANGYDTTNPAQLASTMVVAGITGTGATGASITLPASGNILIGNSEVTLQPYTLTFSQLVSYSDIVLTGDGSTTELPDTYLIIVTFIASP
jgi:hypothetical protein